MPGGENISTVEVEHALTERPAVAECAESGRPDETWGEIPVAYIALVPGVTVTADELIEFCRARLAAFKCPEPSGSAPCPKARPARCRRTSCAAGPGPTTTAPTVHSPLGEKHPLSR